MYNPKDKRVPIFDTVDDNVLSHGHAAASGAKIFLAGTADIGETADHEKTVRDGVDQAISNLDAAAFFRDVQPDVVKIAFGVRGYPVRHFSGAWTVPREGGRDRVL
jgi:hypothetical protein